MSPTVGEIPRLKRERTATLKSKIKIPIKQNEASIAFNGDRVVKSIDTSNTPIEVPRNVAPESPRYILAGGKFQKRKGSVAVIKIDDMVNTRV